MVDWSWPVSLRLNVQRLLERSKCSFQCLTKRISPKSLLLHFNNKFFYFMFLFSRPQVKPGPQGWTFGTAAGCSSLLWECPSYQPTNTAKTLNRISTTTGNNNLWKYVTIFKQLTSLAVWIWTDFRSESGTIFCLSAALASYQGRSSNDNLIVWTVATQLPLRLYSRTKAPADSGGRCMRCNLWCRLFVGQEDE